MSQKREQSPSDRFQLTQAGFLMEWEVNVLRTQIRKNSKVIECLIEKVDLLANKERCPKDANTLRSFRKRLAVSLAENDTFRRVLWRHTQLTQPSVQESCLDPISFLVSRIKARELAQIAEEARTNH